MLHSITCMILSTEMYWVLRCCFSFSSTIHRPITTFLYISEKEACKRCKRLEINSGLTHVARPMARFEWHLHHWRMPELMHLQCYTEWAPSFFQGQDDDSLIKCIKDHGDMCNQGDLYHHYSSSTFSKDLEGDLAKIAGQGKDDVCWYPWIGFLVGPGWFWMNLWYIWKPWLSGAWLSFATLLLGDQERQFQEILPTQRWQGQFEIHSQCVRWILDTYCKRGRLHFTSNKRSPRSSCWKFHLFRPQQWGIACSFGSAEQCVNNWEQDLGKSSCWSDGHVAGHLSLDRSWKRKKESSNFNDFNDVNDSQCRKFMMVRRLTFRENRCLVSQAKGSNSSAQYLCRFWMLEILKTTSFEEMLVSVNKCLMWSY